MSRLRARNSANTAWIDICQSEWYLRNNANTAWVRFTPKQGLAVRHGAEKYWLSIDCMADDDAICGEDQYGGTADGKGANGSGPSSGGGGNGGGNGGDGGSGGNGGGGGSGGDGGGGFGDGGGGGDGGVGNGPLSPGFNDGDGGSGDGKGGNSGGYSDDGGYEPGFDLPDSDGDGGGLQGDCIYRPGLGTCEPYNENPSPDFIDCPNPGTIDCPYECRQGIGGSGRGIWEFYINIGSTPGPIDVSWLAKTGASVDVYYRGQRVASTGGQRIGGGKLNFVYAPSNGVNTIFVRVRTTNRTASWMVEAICAGDEDDGTMDDPRPCTGTFRAEGTKGTYSFWHDMGSKSGVVDIHYQMWSQPDRIDVYDWRGNLIGTTGGYVTGENHLLVNFQAGEFNLIRVVITARDPGTSWIYLIHCPDEKGSKRDPRPCDDTSPVKSGGAGVTDTYINFGPTAGRVGIRYQMWNIPDKLDVFQEGTLIATTGAPVTGDHWLYFNYDPARGTNVNVRVTGEGETTWLFLHTCPGQEEVKISAGDASAMEGSESAPGKLCWDVTLDRASSSPVSVDYASTGGDANPFVAQGRILASDMHGIPFVGVVDAPNVGRVLFDGGFPKFYNNRYTPPMAAPTGEEVFNSWPRTDAGTYYANVDSIPAGSNALNWRLASGNFQCTVNSNTILTMLSPGAYTEYTFSAVLTSDEADDDMVGLVMASVTVGGVLYQLQATRQGGGMSAFGNNFSIVLVVNGSVSRVVQTKNVGSNGNWAGRRSKIEVRRECGAFEVRCSDWSSENLVESSLMALNLADDSQLQSLFNGASQWGFCTQSQDRATFSKIFLSGIGLPPDFTYLKNVALWSARPQSTAALILCDSVIEASYGINTQSSGFGIGIVGTLQSVGFTTTIKHVSEFGSVDTADLAQYGFVLFIASASNAQPLIPASMLAALMGWVKGGGGLMVVTDHDTFQGSANQIASQFNMEFHSSVDRAPMPVSGFISAHGDHPVWDGLSCKTLFGTGSEGGIRVKQVRSDYFPAVGTITFEPGETKKTVCTDLVGNSVTDPDRTVNLLLSNPQNGKIVKETGTGTIQDDDSAICRQSPNEPVYNAPNAGPHGAKLMHVQPNLNCAGANTHYLMQSTFVFANSGPHVFTFMNDDDFEFYLDCKLVASGGIGTKSVTIDVTAGRRTMILRYLNIPHCTPGYAGFSIVRQSSVIYLTDAANWKGQANHINTLDPVQPPPPPPPAPPPPKPVHCTDQPEICSIYFELFGRYPEAGAADFWMGHAASQGINVTTPAGYAALRLIIARAAQPADCSYLGGTYDNANQACILPPGFV